MNPSDLVLTTSGYKVMALRKSDGEVVWQTELIKKFFKPMSPFILLVVDESGIYAHTDNTLFRLEWTTGRVLWDKEFTSTGWLTSKGVSMIATLGSGNGLLAATAGKGRADRIREDASGVG